MPLRTGSLKESAKREIRMDRADYWRAVRKAYAAGTYYPNAHLFWISRRTSELVEQRRPADADAFFAEHFLGGMSELG